MSHSKSPSSSRNGESLMSKTRTANETLSRERLFLRSRPQLQRGAERPLRFQPTRWRRSAEAVVGSLQLGQLDRQEVEVPGGEVVGLVVGDAIRLDLLGRKVPGDVDRDFCEAQLLRRLPAGVADDDD